MAIDFQIIEQDFADLLSNWVQDELTKVCAPPMSNIYLDHLDTIPGDISIADAGQGRINIRIGIEVFVVSEASVMAAANTTPYIVKAGRVRIDLIVSVAGTSLSVAPGPHDFSGLTLPAPAQAAVKAKLNAIISTLPQPLLDFGPRLSAVGAPAPASGRIEVGFGIVAVRFDPSGALFRRISAGEQWGFYLDASAMTAIVSARMAGLPVVPSVTWAPDGIVPQVNFSLQQIIPVKLKIETDLLVDTIETEMTVPFGLSVWGEARFSMDPGPALRMDVSWELDVDLAVAGFVSQAAVEYYEDTIRDRFRAQILSRVPGATATGPRSFFLSFALSEFAFLGSRFRWKNVRAIASGMVIGGTVQGTPSSRVIPDFSVSQFGQPTYFGRCRTGSLPKTFTQWQVKVSAGVDTGDAVVCGADLKSPNEWLGNAIDSSGGSVGFTLTAATGRKIKSPVRMIVRTSRGTRLVDFGKPDIEIDAKGNVTNVRVFYLDDCLYLSGAWLKLATGQRLTVDDFRVPPLEHPDWARALDVRYGVKLQLVRIKGLEAGEFVQLRSPYHELVLSADRHGQLKIPAIVPLSVQIPTVAIQRSLPRPFPSDIVVETVDLSRQAVTEAADANWIESVHDGHGSKDRGRGKSMVPRIVRRSGNVQLAHDFMIGEAEGFVPVRDVDLASLNPQPLPPHPDEISELVRAAGIDGPADIITVPGFEQEQIAIVAFEGRRALVVERDSEGQARVSGRFRGPVFHIQFSGDFAMSRSGDRLLLFTVDRTREVPRSRADPGRAPGAVDTNPNKNMA